jgi:hypothetical protein
MLSAQLFGDEHQALHRVVGVFKNARAQEQPFNIIAAVEIDSQVDHLLHGKSSALNIIALARNAIGAIKYAVIGKQYFEQRNTPPILGIAMANAVAGIPQTLIMVLALAPARSARHIILGRISQYAQFFHYPFRIHIKPKILIFLANKIHKRIIYFYLLFKTGNTLTEMNPRIKSYYTLSFLLIFMYSLFGIFQMTKAGGPCNGGVVLVFFTPILIVVTILQVISFRLWMRDSKVWLYRSLSVAGTLVWIAPTLLFLTFDDFKDLLYTGPFLLLSIATTIMLFFKINWEDQASDI